jgi:hypothetical protein
MSAVELRTASDVMDFFATKKGHLQALTKDVLLQIGEELVKGSPVGKPEDWKKPPHKDYSPGQFIDNWQVGIDENVPSDIVATKDTGGANSLARLRKLGRWQVGHEYTFVNNVPYASALERGYSNQAASGWIAHIQMRVGEFVSIAEGKLEVAQFEKQLELGAP